MKAVRKQKPGGLETLEWVDAPDPGQPAPGELLVRIHASSLNYHDYAVAAGMLRAPEGRIPMSDGAGEVLATGEGVTDYAVGDAVISTFFRDWDDGEPVAHSFESVPGEGVDGYACELVCAPASGFTRAPAGYSHAEAATLPCAALTAWRSLVVEGRIKAGDTVLVQGTGGVSIFALQFAKTMGARVIATSSSSEKLARLKQLGADQLINYKEQPEWGKAVLAATGGRGVDHVVEIGGAGTLPQSILAARKGGHISVIGVLAGYEAPIPAGLIMRKQLRIIGITVGTRRSQLDMIAAIEATGIRPVLDRHFPLSELADAFRYQESGAHFGKIIIDV